MVTHNAANPGLATDDLELSLQNMVTSISKERLYNRISRTYWFERKGPVK